VYVATQATSNAKRMRIPSDRLRELVVRAIRDGRELEAADAIERALG
jgi:hypothetical protein